MKPFTIYHQCRDAFSVLQQSLVATIVPFAKPEAIYLLGASLNRRRSESIFAPTAPSSQHISGCYLLILMPDIAYKELYPWQDTLEARCKNLGAVTTIVLPKKTFEEWLQQGHRFAIKVQQQAPRIYNSDNFKLSVPDAIAHDDRPEPLEKYSIQGLTKAKEFLAGAELFRIRKQYAMAAFMLHQSAEQSLRTLLKTGTGFHANTHNIDRLIRYAGLVAYQLADVFPQQSENDKRLFGLVQKAYVDARYKDQYTISDDELLRIAEKVKRIYTIAESMDKRLFPASTLTRV